jgi:phage repressor protein C with HTH and peptisase S24 domain
VKGGALQVARTAGPHRAAPLSELSVAAGIGRELWDEPCEEWIELPDDVPDGSYVGLTVAGDSMQPLLHAGDVLLVQLGSDIFEDTIVVARHPDDGYVVKRVGDVTVADVELTSLNPAFGPLHIPRDASLIVGTVVMTWCDHRTTSRQRRS